MALASHEFAEKELTFPYAHEISEAMRQNSTYDLSNRPTWIIISHCKEPVKLIQRVKIAHSFLKSVSNLFHFTILSLPM